MDFSGLGEVPRQSPRRRAVYLHNPAETRLVKKHFGLLVQRTLMGSPSVDFSDFSVERGCTVEKECTKAENPSKKLLFP